MFPVRRILFLDAYDSFSNNIIALLEEECGCKVTRVYIDADIPAFADYVSQFSAIVCGPGPGHPAHLTDIGLFKRVWALPDDRIIPVLGICLGFQSLAHEFGASIIRLPQPRHGIKTPVTNASETLFEGLPSIDVVQYHSLYACLANRTSPSSSDRHLWTPSKQCPQLQPLGWDLSSRNAVDSRFSKNPPSILMAVKHITKPFCGIQFHPESICSDQRARQVIHNWWQLAIAWLSNVKPRNTVPDRAEMFERGSEGKSEYSSSRTSLDSTTVETSESSSSMTSNSSKTDLDSGVLSSSLSIGHLDVPSICEVLDLPVNEVIILDSEMRQLPLLGEASIIGIILPDTKKIKYKVGKSEVLIQSGEVAERIDLNEYDNDIFSFLRSFLSDFAVDGNDDRAFCGGLMGYISYEACLERQGIHTAQSADRPDLCFAFIERSILIDHKRDLVHVQGLIHKDIVCDTSEWINETSSTLRKLSESSAPTSEYPSLLLKDQISKNDFPDESDYKYKIAQCKELISAGESYELCLTDQTSITLRHTTSEWSMYRHLRRINPANFGAFVRLGSLTILSTSPERFMKWSRFQKSCSIRADGTKANEQYATCQFRPMKGTVRKFQEAPDGSVHQLSREDATAILATPKEQAENLMILDLIRHDLRSVCEEVSVPGLMVVEDYDSVYQMVSVVEGKIVKPLGLGLAEGKTGIDCLAASLPPGSMTGAPKKRSCQLLQEIEKKPRSIYSGVLGYIDVSGKGDFSVLIRCMYKWDDERNPDGTTWNIGAGGAVTTLSTEHGEWEEMLTKLQSTFRLFI